MSYISYRFLIYCCLPFPDECMTSPSDVYSYHFKHRVILLQQEESKMSRQLQSDANVDVIVTGSEYFYCKCMKHAVSPILYDYWQNATFEDEKATCVRKQRDGYVYRKALDERHGHCPNYMQRRITLSCKIEWEWVFQ